MAERAQEIKLLLNPLRIDDLPLIMAWRNDAEIMRYLPSAPKRLTWEEQLAWWRGRPIGRWDFLIKVLNPNVPWSGSHSKLAPGHVVVRRPVGTSHLKEDGEIGILLGEKGLWGQGIGRQALAKTLEACKYVLEPMVSPPLWAVIHPENIASQHVFAANGFVKTDEPGRNGQEVWRLKP